MNEVKAINFGNEMEKLIGEWNSYQINESGL